ncbi:MAG: hypothetical protein ACYDAR_03115 [Thermomicrobiales bacterium]
MDTGKRFDPTKYLRTIKVRGGTQQAYLPVTARLLWLRADHPDAQLITEALRLDEKSAVFKATVTLPGGAVAVGHGSETAGDFGDFIEKAETKAIGRALTALGYGTEFAEGQDDPTLAAATEVLPAAPPRPTEPIALPATTTPQPPSPPVTLRPERLSRQQEPAPRPERPAPQPEQRAERPTRQPEPVEQRAERPVRPPEPAERPERLARQEEPAERPTRPERFTPTPRGLTADRPIRPERIQATERTEPAEEAPRPAPVERTLRPERLSRLRDVTPPAPEPEPAAEEPTPTPIRRSGRTLAAGRTFTNATAPTAVPTAPAPASPRPVPRAEEPAAVVDDADDMEMAMISTTAFWRWARGKGYADRRAVEAATGKSMDAMTPREAYYRLKEVLAREGNA